MYYGDWAKLWKPKLALPVQSKFSEEVAEWIEAFDDLVVGEGPVQGAELIAALRQRAREAGISTPGALDHPLPEYHSQA